MIILLTSPVVVGNQSLVAGVMADVPDDTARQLVKSGMAKPVTAAHSGTDKGEAGADAASPHPVKKRG